MHVIQDPNADAWYNKSIAEIKDNTPNINYKKSYYGNEQIKTRCRLRYRKIFAMFFRPCMYNVSHRCYMYVIRNALVIHAFVKGVETFL